MSTRIDCAPTYLSQVRRNVRLVSPHSHAALTPDTDALGALPAETEYRMARARTWMSANKALASLLAIVAVAIVLASTLAVASATDEPAFCGSACHEMRPYHAAWQQGAHASVACVECHVDPGPVARVSHKAEAMKELWAHLTGEPRFPLATVAAIPNERCVRCHDEIGTGADGFDHAQHASRATCVSCHAKAGHAVSDAALQSAGVFNDSAKRPRLSSPTATVDRGKANVAGHVSVSCSRCHDMVKTGCAACHKPDHANAGPATKTDACDACHTAGPTFDFTHPRGRSDCFSCHARPAEHRHEGECSKCHTPAATWSFEHPKTQSCTKCHDRPAGHKAGSCSTCHRNTGVNWAFSHSASKNCASCHARPAGHKAGACASCHRGAGTTWRFSHPGSGATCTACHTRPAGHRAGSCTACHSTGTSWTFKHRSSSACSRCHKAPASHYGRSCASCHSPSRAWSSATFRHPSIRGGEHTYRSFACAKCHTNGYASVNCTSCHGANGDDDD